MKGSSKTNPQPGDNRISQVVFADSMQAQPTLKLSEVLQRQRWVILGAMSLGLALSSLYWTKAKIWYESSAKILVSQRDPGLASVEKQSQTSQDMVDTDVWQTIWK